MLQAVTEKNEQYSLVSIRENRLSAANAADFQAILSEIRAQGSRSIILDFSSVAQLDEDFIPVLEAEAGFCAEMKGTLVLCRLQAMVLDQFEKHPKSAAVSQVPSPEEAADLVLFNEIENQLRAESEED